MASSEPAYIMRNRMDHLDARIQNIVASTSRSRALFGSLSYVVIGEAVGSPEVAAFLVMQQAEPVRSNDVIATARVPNDMRLPIGNFTLFADDQELDLDATILTLGPVMKRTNEEFETSIKAQVKVKAFEQGIDESKMLAHHGARFKVILAMEPSAKATD